METIGTLNTRDINLKLNQTQSVPREKMIQQMIDDFAVQLFKVLSKGYTGKIELDCKSGIINQFTYKIRKGIRPNGN